MIKLRKLGEKLGYKVIEDWYRVSLKDFWANNGKSLVEKYDGNACTVVMNIFHNHVWEPWLFHNPSPGYWDRVDSKIKFLQYLI